MDNNFHQLYPAYDRSYLSILKKEIHSLSLKNGFSESRTGEVDIIVAELTSNLIKHAQEGIVLAKAIRDNDLRGVEIISIDKGPGIHDINRNVVDGFSTKNTLGHGLGAIKRLSDFFQAYSIKGWGTIMLSRIYETSPPLFLKTARIQSRDVVVPKPGEFYSGDRFYRRQTGNFINFFLGDGLGHGIDASVAVEKAGEVFMAAPENDPVELIRKINQHAKKTRGLVGTVAVLDIVERKWKICGVGNISTKLLSPDNPKTHISYNGIIGMNVPNTLNSLEVDYSPDQHLIMCSDGIKSRWDLLRLPGILRNDPAIIASAIYRDFTRNNDDASVAVSKIIL
ncbi:SpoIIE family protein phosphatase [Pollutibacter soli]|uniref:SpoIIE family protein phosphatase n=1 Tax=Pollutibacter soli TaxID=3034157 RepID=UPI003013D794